MGTAATITLKNLYDTGDEHVVARIHRNLGGYPAGCGVAVAEAVLAAADTPRRTYPFSGRYERITSRNWAQYFLKKLCSGDADLEFTDADHPTDADYEYVVTGSYDTGELYGLTSDEYLYRINVECISCGVLLFSGNALTFLDWCREPGR